MEYTERSVLPVGQRAGTSLFTLVIKRNPYLPVKENSDISDYISGGSNTNDTGFIILDCYSLICRSGRVHHQQDVRTAQMENTVDI